LLVADGDTDAEIAERLFNSSEPSAHTSTGFETKPDGAGAPN
jgi:hypothetical protein